MKRPALAWLIFGLCLAVVFAAMGWMTRLAVRLDRAEAVASLQAALQESSRLALWRMDSALAPLIAHENSRPYFHYSPFYPAERAYGRMFAAVLPGEVLLPSPLLTAPVPGVLLHFQYDPAGNLSSPQVPVGEFRRIAERTGVGRSALSIASERLVQASRIPRAALLEQFAGMPPEQPAGVTAFRAETGRVDPTTSRPAREMQKQKALSDKEYEARASQQMVLNRDMAMQNAPPALPAIPQRTESGQEPNLAMVRTSIVGDAPMQPAWHGDSLILVRRIWVDGKEYLQGCWLDWPSLRESLLGSVRDLLPWADLKPVLAGATSPPGLRLAALPVELIPGSIDGANGRTASLLRTSLPVAWIAVLVAVLAAGLLLHKSIVLSERRGAFVSAVTHELRTPLTTFRLYTDMLAEGMATTERDRRDFLDTLRHEAERLDHLVRNVLAYARLERNPTSATLEEIRVSDLLNRFSERLAARGAEAGFTVEIQAESEAGARRIRTDPSAVEQILFNLVDNAAKYAASAAEKRIEVRARPSGPSLQLSVRDYGPGLSQAARKHLFRPFSKSAVEAARSAPGVGLGLALSRRLARSLGGDLALDPRVSPGACFVFTVGGLVRYVVRPAQGKPWQ